MLAVLTRDQIAHAMFPLGDTPKTSVRAEAAERGLLVADKPDSHDVCFIADGDTRGLPGPASSARRPGEIVDADGTVLGSHEGAFGFTVGQRKGLRLDRPAPDGNPRYVLSIEPVSNTVTVGPADALGYRDHRDPPGLDRLRAAALAGRVLGPAPRARRGLPVRRLAWPGDELMISLRRTRAGAWRRARRPCSTTATRCWAAPPSPPPADRHRFRWSLRAPTR